MVAFANQGHRPLEHARQNPRKRFNIVDCEVVSILGADCPLGRRIMEVAISCGYRVQALVHKRVERSPDSNMRFLTSDSFDARHIQTVVRSSSCVINLCNVGGYSFKAGVPNRETISQNALQAMQKSSCLRYLLVTHQSVTMPGDHKLNPYGIAAKYVYPLFNRRRHQEMQKEAELVSRTKFNWTIVRCPKIKDLAGTGCVRAVRHHSPGRFVALDRLARYLVHLKDSDFYKQQAIFVGNQPAITRVA